MKKIIILLISFFIIGCNNDDFSPNGELENNIAAYMILDNSTNTQFMKIQKMYFENDLGKRKVDPNRVVIFLNESSTNNRYVFRDTVLSFIDNYSVFYIPSFKPRRGSRYDIRIFRLGQAASEITSSIVMPPAVDIKITDNAAKAVYDYMHSSEREPKLRFNYNFKTTMANSICATIFNVYILYEVNKDGNIIKGQIQIPVGNTEEGSNGYPTLRGTSETKNYLKIIPVDYDIWDRTKSYSFQENFSIDQNVFLNTMIQIGKQYRTWNVTITKGYIAYQTYDKNIYDYLHSLGSAKDEYSVRLDNLNWSNMKVDGIDNVGLFGAISKDTAYFNIDSTVSSLIGYGTFKDPYYDYPFPAFWKEE